MDQSGSLVARVGLATETCAASAGQCGALVTGVDLGMETWATAAAYSGVHLAVLLAFHVDVRRQGKAKDVAS